MRAFLPLTLGVVLTVAMVGAGRAQTSPDAGGAPADAPKYLPSAGVKKHLELLTKRLELTPDQQERIVPLLHDEEVQAAPIFAKQAIGADDKEVHRFREEARNRISAVLTPAQRDVLGKMIMAHYLD